MHPARLPLYGAHRAEPKNGQRYYMNVMQNYEKAPKINPDNQLAKQLRQKFFEGMQQAGKLHFQLNVYKVKTGRINPPILLYQRGGTAKVSPLYIWE